MILSSSLRSPLVSSRDSMNFYSYWVLLNSFSCFVLIYSLTVLSFSSRVCYKVWSFSFVILVWWVNCSYRECRRIDVDWFILNESSGWLISIDMFVMSESDTFELSPATKSVLLTFPLTSRCNSASHYSCLLNTLTTESPSLFSFPLKVTPSANIPNSNIISNAYDIKYPTYDHSELFVDNSHNNALTVERGWILYYLFDIVSQKNK